MHSPPVQPISVEQLRDRLGDHDVARGQRQPPAHARHARRAPPRWRARRPARAPGRRAASATTLVAPPAHGADRGPLVDLDPALAQPVGEPAREPRRLHGRRPAVERAAAKDRRVAAAPHLGRASSATQASGLAELAAGAGGRLPGAVPGGGGRDLQVAGLAVPGVDALLAQKSPISTTERCAARATSIAGRVAEPLAQRRQAEPEPVDEAAVAPARPLAAAVGLERTTRASGSSRFRCQAVHSPV